MAGDNPSRKPRSSTFRRCVFALVVLAGTGFGVVVLSGVAKAPAGVGSPPAASKSAERGAGKASLDIVEAVRMRFDITTTALGELRAKNQIELRNELDSESTITEILPEGTFVEKGTVLIRLNSEEIENRIDEETLQLKSAQADAVAAENDYEIQESENDSALRAARLKVEIAELDLQKWLEGEVKIEQLSQAHAIERAEKEVQRLREVLEKSRSLHAEGFYATDRLKQDERDYEQAVNDLAKARLDKQVYEEYTYKKDEKQKRSDVEEAKAELERVERQNASRLASKAAERDNRREVLAQRQRLMQKYEQQLERATIAAPAAGLVVYASSMEQNRWGDDSGPLQVGSKVWANQTLIILPDTSEMVAAVRVHESMAGRIRRGQRTSVKVDAFGEQRFPGVVESIGILAESTGGWRDPDRKEYTVRVVLDREAVAQAAGGDDAPGADGSSSMSDGGGTNDRRGLKPSMRAEAEIILGSVEDAVAVPIQAVFNEGVMRFVHVRDGSSGRFVKRPVLVGRRSDRFAEILGGLVASEQVLLRKPEPGELSNRAPDATELAAAGLTLDESGRIIAVPRPAPSGGRRLQGPGGPGGPGGNEPAASRGKPAAVPVIATPAKPAGEPVTDTPAATTSAPAGESAAPAKQ